MNRENIRQNLKIAKENLQHLKSSNHDHVWFKINENKKYCPICHMITEYEERLDYNIADISFYFTNKSCIYTNYGFDELFSFDCIFNYLKKCSPTIDPQTLSFGIVCHLHQLLNEKSL